MTALSDLLRDANVDQLSTREIARRAEKNGHALAQPTVSVYMGGRHGTPTESVLAAFSDVLNIPIDKLRRAAGVPVGAGTPWAPPAEANRLDLRQRRALEELIRSMVTSETLGEDQDGGKSKTTRSAAPAAGGRGVARDAERDGVKAGEEAWPLVPEPLTKADVDFAADTGRSRREPMDAESRRRGEESQDPGHDEPA